MSASPAVQVQNALIKLVEACKEMSISIAPAKNNLPCHNDLCSKEKCRRCQRAKKFYKALKDVEQALG